MITTTAPDRTVIDLATRIQRRRDFAAHLTGYGAGTLVLVATWLSGAGGGTTVLVVALTWATALSFQHFRHVLFGAVTPAEVVAEERRLGMTGSGNDRARRHEPAE